MSKDYPQLAQELGAAIREVRKGIPDTMKGFGDLAKAATAEGALSTRHKELMATAIGIAIRCDGCIAFHVKAAVRAGATREEMLETIGMAVYMGGGPSSVYGSLALQAYDQFTAPKE
ncbi:MAG: carboxymuconolactone decarboxylase family protein [Hyphomicrobiales bacterium]|nr:carboxymuconolactone decarboxylase family protein [Hyphomicrobiales bacterium]MCP5370401.1 carboxymuconolactone decarboxylase family protein [Hyphomicrobiales bacterium]